MVKIPDLTNKQLVAQLEKYGKIVDQLAKERNARVVKKDSDDLYTKKELVAREAAKPKTPQASADGGDNLLSFDDEELDAMDEVASKQEIKEEDDEEVRVTQLLQLSKEDLAALQANKKKMKKKG